MKRVMWVSVVSAVMLSACASEPKIDYAKVDAECGRICQKNNADCVARFSELPTLLYTHCKPELAACVKVCPPPGTTPVPSPASSTFSTDARSIADRLKMLEELHKSGVLTDKEYADKRQEILKSL